MIILIAVLVPISWTMLCCSYPCLILLQTVFLRILLITYVVHWTDCPMEFIFIWNWLLWYCYIERFTEISLLYNWFIILLILLIPNHPRLTATLLQSHLVVYITILFLSDFSFYIFHDDNFLWFALAFDIIFGVDVYT